MANSVEQVDVASRSMHDLVESIFQDVQREDGDGTAVVHDHNTTRKIQVLSISSAASTVG